jgi:hypothetical protein
MTTPDLPPLPDTEWVLRMPPSKYEDGWDSHQDGYTDEQMRAYAQAYGDARAAAAVLAEREKSEAMRAALVELVACDDLRIRAGNISPVEPGCEKEVLMDEWRRRNRIAWAAARAAIRAEPKEQQP